MPGNAELLKRVTARPDVFGGKPIVRDMRISVEIILSLLSQGATQEEVLDDYPELEPGGHSRLHRLCPHGDSRGLAGPRLSCGVLRFLVDRCAGRRLAEWLRTGGHDVIEARTLDAYESIRRLKMLAAVTRGTLVPSHDPALWEAFNPAPYRYT